jgi:hypothetical protein
MEPAGDDNVDNEPETSRTEAVPSGQFVLRSTPFLHRSRSAQVANLPRQVVATRLAKYTRGVPDNRKSFGVGNGSMPRFRDFSVIQLSATIFSPEHGQINHAILLASVLSKHYGRFTGAIQSTIARRVNAAQS